MKKILLLTLLTAALPAWAYQSLGSSKAGFGPAAQATAVASEEAPATSQTRTFSTYQSRQHNWNKDNSQNGEPAAEVAANAQELDAAALSSSLAVMGQTAGASAPAVAAPKEQAKQASKAAAPDVSAASSPAGKGAVPSAKNFQTGAAAGQAAPAADPMGEIQKMLDENADMMKALSSGNLPGGSAPGGSLPSAGGMPDLSAILGGSQPKK